MRKKYSLILLLCLCATFVFSQEESAKFKFDKKKYFHSIAFSVVMSCGYTPAKQVSLTDPLLESSSYVTLVSFFYEPRYNFYEMNDRLSFSVSSPVELGLNVFTGGDQGMFGIHVPLFCDLNYKMHATMGNVDKYGFQVSAGLIGHYGPIIAMFGNYNFQRTWLTPAVRAAFKFPYKGKNMYCNFMYGFGNSIQQNTGITNEKVYEKLSFSLSVGYLLNYEIN